MFRTPWRQSLCWWLVAASGLLVVYGPALHGGFLWDDDVHISANEALRSGLGLARIWFEPGAVCQYYPLSFSAFWLEYHLWGLDPLGYHVVNVLLHAAVAVLLWQVLRRLRVPGAGLAAAIFAVHPVMVMSVAWMTELKNTLAAALALGAIWAYLRFARVGVYGQRPEARGQTSEDRGQRPEVGGQRPEDGGQRVEWGFYLLALGLFQLAMFAKTAVSFVPATLLLILWWQRPRLRWADVWPLAPMLAIVIVMGRITAQVEGRMGATGPAYDHSVAERVLIAGRSFWFYLGKLVWPAHLSFIYPRWDVEPTAWWQWSFPVAAGLLMAGLRLVRGRLGKAPLVASLYFFLCTSALILGLTLDFTRYSFVSDHWQYFGAPAICALAGAGIQFLVLRSWCFVPSPWTFGRGWVGAVMAGLLLMVLAGASWRQSHLFADEETLWRATLRQNPESDMACDNLGLLLLRTGRIPEAVFWFKEEVRLHPRDEAGPHNNLGTALLELGRIPEAAAEFEESMRLNPNYDVTHNNLGDVLNLQGQPEAALAEYQTALRLKPDHGTTLANLAGTLLELNRAREALTAATRAVVLAPDEPVARHTLGKVLHALGRNEEAVRAEAAALQLRPDYPAAQVNLAVDLMLLGRGAEAMPQLAAVVRLHPDNFDAHNDYGLALAMAGRGPEAALQFEAALRLRPDRAATHTDLGKVYLLTGRKAEAAAQFNAALQLQPDNAEARAGLQQAHVGGE